MCRRDTESDRALVYIETEPRTNISLFALKILANIPVRPFVYNCVDLFRFRFSLCREILIFPENIDWPSSPLYEFVVTVKTYYYFIIILHGTKFD